jgi:serine/threonine-protein kinase
VVTATGRDWTFSVGKVEAPSGLYRASVDVTNATVVGGWIVLPDGRQVGTQRKGGAVSPAPPLNVANGTSVLGGATVTVTAIDGSKL